MQQRLAPPLNSAIQAFLVILYVMCLVTRLHDFDSGRPP
jgi:hypothetical protein